MLIEGTSRDTDTDKQKVKNGNIVNSIFKQQHH